MEYTIRYMKRFFQNNWVLACLAVVFAISLAGLRVEASDPSLFSLQPGAEGGDAAVVKAWNNENNYKDDQAGWGNIKIYYKGDFFGDQTDIPFNLDDTNATTNPGPFDTSRPPGSDTDKREPVYSFTYYCDANDHKITLS